MIIEKLLFHTFIILTPVLIQTSLLEHHKWSKSPIFTGVLNGFATLTCLAFTYEFAGLYWDFRYVPLIIAMVYGGRKAGLIVLAFMLIGRTIMGGDILFHGLASAVIASVIPYYFSRGFWKMSPVKRVVTAQFIGLWPIAIIFLMLFAFNLPSQFLSELHSITFILQFGLVQVIGIGIAARLNEWMVEKKVMREEIIKSEKLNTLGELAASIAHEVRNPLTVVKGFLQLMKRQAKGEEDEYLAIILSELGRAEEIINDYLNFAKPQFEKVERVHIKEILSEVSILLNAYAVKENVFLESHLDDDGILLTDRNKMKQALINFVKNAIEATPPKGYVSISLQVSEENAVITVKDTGKGMSKEEIARIGTMFYTTKNQGTGLGTSVSLKIIETIGGHVTYSSEVKKGTTVEITLPLRNEKLKREHVLSHHLDV